MEPSPKLPGATLKRLQEALLAAFPTRSALAQMVRVGLDENLDAVAAPETLSVAVFELIRWAEARGRLDELIAAARQENPGNRMLRAFAEELARQEQDPTTPSLSQNRRHQGGLDTCWHRGLRGSRRRTGHRSTELPRKGGCH